MAVSLLATSCASLGGGDDDPDQFYKGKTVTMVLGFAPGGGSDTGMRIIAKYWSKYIPGKPKLVIENRDGAAGVIASNYIYEEAENDGLTLLTNSGAVWRNLARPEGVRYDLTEMPPIGGVSSNYVVVHSLDDVPADEPWKIADTDEQIRYAGVSVDSPPDAVAKIPFEILGMNEDQVKYIYGYEGSGDTFLAMERGEADVLSEGVSAYTGLNPEGDIKPLWQGGALDENGEVVRHPSLPDMPTAGEVIEEITGAPPSGPLWDAYKAIIGTAISLSWVLVAPPGTPEDRLAPLREGFAKMIDDPEFIAELDRAAGEPLPVYDWEETDRLIKEVASTPQESLDALLDVLYEAGT